MIILPDIIQTRIRILELEQDREKAGNAIHFDNENHERIVLRILGEMRKYDPSIEPLIMGKSSLRTKWTSDEFSPEETLARKAIILLIEQAQQRKPDQVIEGKDTPPSPSFELIGQVMGFHDGVQEFLNDAEAEFVKLVIERSKEGLVADMEALGHNLIHDPRADIRFHLKQRHARTSKLIQ